MMPQTRHWGVFSLPQAPCFTMQLGCMSFLEYMGFVLVLFPLKCGFIIVQVCINCLFLEMDICVHARKHVQQEDTGGK